MLPPLCWTSVKRKEKWESRCTLNSRVLQEQIGQALRPELSQQDHPIASSWMKTRIQGRSLVLGWYWPSHSPSSLEAHQNAHAEIAHLDAGVWLRTSLEALSFLLNMIAWGSQVLKKRRAYRQLVIVTPRSAKILYHYWQEGQCKVYSRTEMKSKRNMHSENPVQTELTGHTVKYYLHTTRYLQHFEIVGESCRRSFICRLSPLTFMA